jgi:hypothetical protein
MGRLIVGMLGWFGFGVLLAEIVNHLNWFESDWKVGWVAVPVSLGFLVFELALRHCRKKAALSPADEIRFRRLVAAFQVLQCLAVAVLLLAVPFLWWGAIKKLAALANQGFRF